MNTWLIQHLKNIGAYNEDRVGRKISGRVCPGCGVTVLVALDADVAGLPSQFHAAPLSTQGEGVCMRLGWRRFRVDSTGRVYSRDELAAMKKPADDNTVLVEHECGIDYAALCRDAPPKKRSKDDDEKPTY